LCKINLRKQAQAQEKLPLGVGVDTVVIPLAPIGISAFCS